MKILLMLLMVGNTADIETLFEDSISHIKNKNWTAASETINAAINSGRVSDYGLSELYWQLYFVEKNLNNGPRSAEALLGFNAYIHAVIESIHSEEELAIIQARINFSGAVLQSLWAAENNYSCRSKKFKCSVANETLLSVFVIGIPFCKDGTIDEIGLVKDGKDLIMTAHCSQNNSFHLSPGGFGTQKQITENYYFELP